MSGYTKELSRATVLYQDATLIASGNSVVSSWFRLPRRDVTITKTHTTGTYAITLDWSMDGTNVVFTEAPVMVNSVPQTFVARAPYLRVTIAASVLAFTVHQTTVML